MMILKQYILFDLGDSNLDVNSTETILEFSRSFRLKVLNEKGLMTLANQIISLHIGSSNEEKIGRLKGGVYNLVDGNVVFEKLKNNDWAIEPYDENTKVARVAFRNVKVGSIIEFEYTIFSPFVYNMRDWQFQYDDIPVLYSEYYIRYPEKVGYKILKLGYHPLHSQMIKTETKATSDVGISTRYTTKQVYAMACENIPAMRTEPFMDSPENYRTKVLTELHYHDYDTRREFYYKNWDEAVKEFLKSGENAMFMEPKRKDKHLTLDSIDCSSLKDSVEVIYTKLLKQFSNSEEPNYRTMKRKPQEIMDSKKATPNELNMLLVYTLRANGIEAYPVLVTTRSNQRVLKQFALVSQFTSHLTYIETVEGSMLLDVSASNLAPGEISERFYNGEGLLLNKKKVEWIPIVSAEPTSESCTVEFNTLEANELKGVMRLKLSGIYRSRINNALLYSSSSKIADFLNMVPNASLTFIEEESDLKSHPMDLRFDISLKMEKFGNSYLFPAIVFDSMANNVLKEKERQYPVNFPDSWSESYTCVVHLDSDKFDAQLPDKANFALPENDGKFSYMGSYTFGTLVLRSKVEVNKNIFVPSEYPVLRHFYDLVSTTHSSFIEFTEK